MNKRFKFTTRGAEPVLGTGCFNLNNLEAVIKFMEDNPDQLEDFLPQMNTLEVGRSFIVKMYDLGGDSIVKVKRLTDDENFIAKTFVVCYDKSINLDCTEDLLEWVCTYMLDSDDHSYLIEYLVQMNDLNAYDKAYLEFGSCGELVAFRKS